MQETNINIKNESTVGNMTTWLITGCSSGLGRCLAQEVLKQGFRAVITARNPVTIQDIVAPYPDTALAIGLDVTDRKQVSEAVRQAEIRFGEVDVLVNNAGHGYRAAVEEGESNEVDELFATNFFGPIALIKAVLPGMRSRSRGTIINVSSIAGRMAMPGSGYYSATKFALEGMSIALCKEVSSLGIRVIVVEPGEFRTNFSGRSLMQSQTVIADYANTSGQRRKENDKSHGNQQGDPVRGAQAIIKVVQLSEPPFRLLLVIDAVRVIGTELDEQRTEMDTWKEISMNTNFPE